MQRIRTITAGLAAAALTSMVTGPAGHAQASSGPLPPRSDLYVYGHSWTTGYGLSDPTRAYPWLVAADRGLTLHALGRNGALVHRVANRLYGTGPSSWRAGADGDVVIQAVSNTARDRGIDRLSLATTRNSLRVMLATVSASRRIENTDRSLTYGGSWHTHLMAWASGGSVRATTHNGAFVQFRAVGGEYVSLRGVPGDGVTVRLSDRTAGHTVTRIHTGHRVHPSYSHRGIPLLYRIPPSLAGHTVRLTKESGSGSLVLDARLPQRAHPGTAVLVEEPHLADYSLTPAHPMGSDAVMDAFNHVVVQVADEFPNAVAVDPNASGWDAQTMLLPHSTHPDEAGHRFLADLVEGVLGGPS